MCIYQVLLTCSSVKGHLGYVNIFYYCEYCCYEYTDTDMFLRLLSAF